MKTPMTKLMLAAAAATMLCLGARALEQDTDGYYMLGSVQDWRDFAALVDTNPAANAKMTADIDLGDDQTQIGSDNGTIVDFEGIFDGQGHTLTIKYNGTVHRIAPFRGLNGGTIKNLHVTGTINSSQNQPASIAAVTVGSTVISNVWSDVTITSTGTSWVEAGAFVGLVYAGSLTLKDCLFSGAITSPSSFNGCFVGYISGGSATLANCLATGTFSYTGGSIAFCGNHSNCYVKQFPVSYPSGVTQPTDDELSGGTTATALQAGREEEVWVQDAKTGQPMLKMFSKPLTLYDGLVAYYKFDGDLTDASFNGHNLSGTAYNWTEDRKGNANSAASFNGSGYLTPSPIFQASDNFTLAAWVKPGSTIRMGMTEATSGTSGDSAVNANSIVFFPANGGYGLQSGVGVCVGQNAVVVIEHRNNTVAPSLVWYGDIGSQWAHIAVTVSDSGAPELYVNGDYVKMGKDTGLAKKIGNPTNGSGNSNGTIAGGASWKSFIGSIDEIMIYDRALAGSEIKRAAKLWSGDGDGTEGNPCIITSNADFDEALNLGGSLFITLANSLTLDGPLTVPANVSALTIDLNDGSITGATGQAAIVLAGDTAFAATGTGTISADDGIEAVKRPGSVTAANGVTVTGIGGGGATPAPTFAADGKAATTEFVQGEGGKWTLTTFAELSNDAVGADVAAEQIKVYAADTVEGLESASPMTSGVTVKEKKSAVKTTIEVTPPPAAPAQFFKVKFGE